MIQNETYESDEAHHPLSWERAHCGGQWKQDWDCHRPNMVEIGGWPKHFLFQWTNFRSGFLGLMQMKSLDPTIRGCRFSWESENLIYHSRYVCTQFYVFLIWLISQCQLVLIDLSMGVPISTSFHKSLKRFLSTDQTNWISKYIIILNHIAIGIKPKVLSHKLYVGVRTQESCLNIRLSAMVLIIVYYVH